MRKLILLLAVLTGFALSSCSKDDEDNNGNGNGNGLEDVSEASLIGTWKLTQVTVNGTVEPQECPTFRIFTTDEITSQEYFGANCEEMDSMVISYMLEGTTLNLTGDGFTDSVEIVSFSSTTMKITYEESFDGENWVYVDTYTKQ